MAYEKYLGEQIKVTVEGDLDLTKAKGVAKQKVKDLYPDAMLLSWCIGKTGENNVGFEFSNNINNIFKNFFSVPIIQCFISSLRISEIYCS